MVKGGEVGKGGGVGAHMRRSGSGSDNGSGNYSKKGIGEFREMY